ncbi:MAG: putative toxin-antitoxin system toxin component, PIN family [Anaerolineae bacterium]|nr:putative toxin-antitoxin system toxin component, PIN family [Anaerolineae bacterium]
MATDPTRLRAVFDTNVVIAALLSRNPHSPLVELLRRWRNDEFELLYCDDLRAEYREKLIAKGVQPDRRHRLLEDLTSLGTCILLTPDDLVPRIPDDPDDDVVIACAIAGEATHLVTYDPHLHTLGAEYQGVRILDGLHFLYTVRGDVPPPH